MSPAEVRAWAIAEVDALMTRVGEPAVGRDPELPHCGFQWTERGGLKLSWACNRDPGHLDAHHVAAEDGTILASRAQRRRKGEST